MIKNFEVCGLSDVEKGEKNKLLLASCRKHQKGIRDS